jgi:hypothetical protein
MQAMYWSTIDPPRGDRLFQRALEIDASMDLSTDPVAYSPYYLSRLRRANGREEELALLDYWRADIGNSTDMDPMPGAFALCGDTRTALELQSRVERSGGPMRQFAGKLSDAVLASALGHVDEAEQHLATAASIARDHAMPRGEAGCLVGFARVALDRGDYARASRLLAAVKASGGPEHWPFRSNFDALVYFRCVEALREVLDSDTARTTQAEGSALSPKDALDAELIRTGTTAMAKEAD